MRARALTVEVGRLGVWAPLQAWSDEGGRIADVGAELEELGFGAIWVGNGTEMFEVVSTLLDATGRLAVATGIANIKTHPVGPTAARYSELAARHSTRLLLGLGGGWGRVDPGSGQGSTTWYARMVDYLDELDSRSPPVPPERRVLAANGPRMLALSRERSVGAHPFLVTPEHTRWARQILGSRPLLAPEQKVVLESTPTRARAIARRNLGFYLSKANYLSVLRRLGFAEEDFADGGSDRLVDSLVAWGDIESVRRRVDQHLEAGANHVALQVLSDGTDPGTPEQRRLPREHYRRLGEALSAPTDRGSLLPRPQGPIHGTAGPMNAATAPTGMLCSCM